ncbi:MAG: DUF3105 domain-containing protein [Rubrobacteraceae bacterium]
MILIVFLAVACGEESSSGSTGEAPGKTTATTTTTSGGSSGETTAAMPETTAEENAYDPNAEIWPNEETNMTPADGNKPDEPQPLPQNPPEGVKTYPANGNALVEGEIQYDRDPPTNGKHSPMWQNCGFYSEPVDKKTAVHSMDHGVVWISYRPNLPADQVEQLRPYGDEEYVIVSPYPDLPAPVVATAWRNQIHLDGASDPRLREFVDGFRISELAPLSGNRCVGGVGQPDA